jgi:hypothetical protein
MKTLPVILCFLMLIECGMAQESLKRGKSPARRFPVPIITGEPSTILVNPLARTNLPILAVWQDNPGYNADTNYPYLRVAIWSDGWVVFARDPNVWNHDLLLGRISEQTLDKLKQDIRKTGVFDLRGNCYLVPDASVDCVMLSFGNSQQLLYWDEVEHSSYGININPKPQHLAFKKAWWEVNQLVLSALPEKARKINTRFQKPPNGWYLKRMIQSE